MIARPKAPPSIVVELSQEEALALVRALTRAEEPVRAAGNTLDVQRLAVLREGLKEATRGAVAYAELEPS